MKINIFEKIIGTAAFTGFIPFAPGTMGSILALLIFMIPGFENPMIMLSLILVFTILGVRIAGKFELVYGKDPSVCVVDEVVGTWISLLFVPKNYIVIIAFVTWRLLDILKPFPIGKVEKIPGGWGIMLDDIAAGFITFLLVQIGIIIF